ncbi:nucleotide kinase [Staphylococcus phage S-CoN_Ph19]|nr:nucleotide kinase [Staphylococcus phage S-CoN_Ph18]WNM54591.1 nucleotide kinase [Staphylococcus phage S-CoN_Ph19]WNM54686.1 nucleotide kinase [Staphylococcus phage S-CoN_Ph20]WNM54760.1 nucleotide kinase [Staphylococcus phage S-CoN_Ph21]WNM54801.1 nucleotide kinase [Staphylococcus phage S-CoN_Ph22]WNM54944.1 nucleotide kinase [Staphylococcus phage S-CoN_Ph24]
MSVGDLSIGEYIKFSDRDNKQRYGQVLNVYQDVFYLIYVAVVKVDGIGTIEIDDNYDFISVPKPTSKEVEKTLDDKVNRPTHYTYGDIEIIDFIEQVTKDYKPELAFAIGNAIKYISRANRKNGKEDLDKARWYLNRAFEKWEG